jgi:hypothetical protein
MIDRRELLLLAENLGLQPQVVEKDYVLGWLRGENLRAKNLRAIEPVCWRPWRPSPKVPLAAQPTRASP